MRVAMRELKMRLFGVLEGSFIAVRTGNVRNSDDHREEEGERSREGPEDIDDECTHQLEGIDQLREQKSWLIVIITVTISFNVAPTVGRVVSTSWTAPLTVGATPVTREVIVAVIKVTRPFKMGTTLLTLSSTASVGSLTISSARRFRG